ncbi:MAG: hypothetical protein JWO53_1289, partial [Chlamydiia bacterium]|nr:hypothetical protein [Chlamydiia bacterium]
MTTRIPSTFTIDLGTQKLDFDTKKQCTLAKKSFADLIKRYVTNTPSHPYALAVLENKKKFYFFDATTYSEYYASESIRQGSKCKLFINPKTFVLAEKIHIVVMKSISEGFSLLASANHICPYVGTYIACCDFYDKKDAAQREMLLTLRKNLLETLLEHQEVKEAFYWANLSYKEFPNDAKIIALTALTLALCHLKGEKVDCGPIKQLITKSYKLDSTDVFVKKLYQVAQSAKEDTEVLLEKLCKILY